MGIHTGMILINIFIICVISIAIVKIYYRKHPEADVDISLFGSYNFFTNRTTEDTDKIISENERIILQSERNKSYANVSSYFNGAQQQQANPRNMAPRRQPNSNVNARQNPNYNHRRAPNKPNPYAVNNNNNYNLYNTQPKKEGDTMSQNNSQVNVGKIEKKDIAEKIEKDNQNKIITTDQSTKKETYTEIAEAQPKVKDQELKDLFTIDELIKESKRKSTPGATPSTSSTSTSTTSPKKEVPTFLTPEERDSMKDHVEEMENELNQKASERKLNQEVESVQKETVTDVYKHTQSPINSPILRSPRKTDTTVDDIVKQTVEKKIEEMPKPIDQSTKKETYTDIAEAQPRVYDEPTNVNLFDEAATVNFEDDEGEDYNDLDYRKDIARITNRVKNSRIFNDVKNKLKVEEEPDLDPTIDEEFLRNVRSYDAPQEVEPEEAVIIPERDFDGFETPYIEPEREESKEEKAKKLHIEPPKKEELDLKINNNPAKLKKGDEIIFRYHGETYSSKVLRINGDDISVKFRGQNITIKPSDVKKIF